MDFIAQAAVAGVASGVVLAFVARLLDGRRGVN